MKMRVFQVITVLSILAACAGEPTYDLVLRGGRVMDPETGLDSILNVAIRDGKIALLTDGQVSGDVELDVSGLVVAPGFIDLHAHGQNPSDLALKAQDGVTTALELEAGVYPVAEWYATLEGQAPINYGASVGHINVRMSVFHPDVPIMHWPTQTSTAASLGAEPAGTNSRASAAQLEGIAGGVAVGLNEGALGVGFGINYSPGAEPAEIATLFATAAQRNAPVFVHTRAFGLAAIDEVIETAESTGASLHIVHINSSSLQHLDDALQRVADARARGMDVTTETYPYTAASTRLESAMFNPGWQDNLPIDYQDIEFVSTGERLTAETFDTRRAEGGWIILYMMQDEHIDRAVAGDGVIIASDGVPFVDGKGHPRGAGTYARVLGHYVRERQVIPLMDALSKMTLLPARRLETIAPTMRSKGRVQEGADADLTIFDAETILDRATFAEPTLPSAGIPHVIVGGTFVVRDGNLIETARPGVGIRGEGNRQ